LADIDAGMKDRANLPNEDIAGTNLFAAKTLYSPALAVRIAPVAAGALTFLMCHDVLNKLSE
jgi:hypothetical protein